MQHDTSKSDATTADSNAAAPVYIDDRELERRVPAVRRATWQKMRHEGRGPAWIKIGRRCVYSWAEVVAWLESHRVGGDASGGAAP
jgi:predicted DNA-binding transcriptional regulator AlpA